MKILVCISVVPDTTTKVKFIDGKEFDKAGVQWIINPWDELALTRALELKEASAGKIEKITVVNVGAVEAEATIRKALAMGADEAIRINTTAKDTFSVAGEISEAIKDQGFDVIFSGIESSDFNGVGVGGMIAEILDIQSVSAVSGIDFADDVFKVKRDIDGGFEMLEVKAPFVATVQKGIAIDPRIPNMRGIMMAKKKPLNVVESANCEPLSEYVQYEMPKPKPPVKLVENAAELVNVLHNEAKML
ncbi:MAG: electron transfer flavoprotein subunit beta/FixA family protein [Bacteroidales bacterium]|nr:electron transfer flavoprotein subunit beta/FixA family protein [Bacteroidales bacterium]